MTTGADVAMLGRRIDEHSIRIEELLVARAMRGGVWTFELDREIDRRERWRSILARLRNLLSE